MKTSLHLKIDQLLEDPAGTKISLYVSVDKNRSSSHVVVARLRESALRILIENKEKYLALELRRVCRELQEKLRENVSGSYALLLSTERCEILFLEHEVPSRVIVAQSWHVKPLLYSSEEKLFGYIVEFHSQGVSLIQSDGEEHRLLETYLPPFTSVLPSKTWPENLNRETYLGFLEFIGKIVPQGHLVHVSCAPEGVAQSPQFWKKFWHNVTVDEFLFGLGRRERVFDLFGAELKRMKDRKKPFDLVNELSSTAAISDIREILRRIAVGKIRKLFVSLDAIRWGEVNNETLSVKPGASQRNHFDEDILDDVAEFALKKGVVVRILRQEKFPGKHEIIAC